MSWYSDVVGTSEEYGTLDQYLPGDMSMTEDVLPMFTNALKAAKTNFAGNVGTKLVNSEGVQQAAQEGVGAKLGSTIMQYKYFVLAGIGVVLFLLVRYVGRK